MLLFEVRWGEMSLSPPYLTRNITLLLKLVIQSATGSTAVQKSLKWITTAEYNAFYKVNILCSVPGTVP